MEKQTEGGTEVLGWVAELQRGESVEVNSRRIFRRYYGWVRSFFTRRRSTFERAEELTQETFLQAFQGIGSFRGGGTFESWLFAIAANRWRNERRRSSRQKRDAPEVSLDDELPRRAGSLEIEDDRRSPEETALEKERLSQVMEIIGGLPAKQRQCLQLRFAGYDYSKIAELLRLSQSTVRVHVHAARKRLQDELEEPRDGIR